MRDISNLFITIFLGVVLLISIAGVLSEPVVIEEAVFGELYKGNNLITIPNKGVFVPFSNLDDGLLYNVESFNNTLIIQEAGVYKIQSNIAASGTANTEYHSTIKINGLVNNKCYTMHKVNLAGQPRSLSYSCFKYLEVGDIVTPVVKNVNNNGDFFTFQTNFLILKID